GGGDGGDQSGHGDHEARGALADAEFGADGREQADGEHLGGHDGEDAEGDGGHGEPLLEGGPLGGGGCGADAFEDAHGTAFRSRFSARPGWVLICRNRSTTRSVRRRRGRGLRRGRRFLVGGVGRGESLAPWRCAGPSPCPVAEASGAWPLSSRLAPSGGLRPVRGPGLVSSGGPPGAPRRACCGPVPHSTSLHPYGRNGEDMSTEGGTKAVVAALLANTGIAVSKFVAAGITGSASMLAEGVHSVADASNQGLLLLGGKRAKREASPAHPFGYGRERYIYSFIVAIVLFSVGGLY